MTDSSELAVGSVWTRLGASLSHAGSTTYSWAKERYKGISPEFRAQLGETPLLALTLLAPNRTPTRVVRDEGHRLIVFVHGLAGHRGNFLPMQNYFRWMGRPSSVSVGFPRRHSIEEMAEHLKRTIEELVRENNLPADKCIDVVAHSMGGIITRLALQEPKFAARIHTVITLATPHHGTQLARYLDTAKVRQLKPKSQLLTDLSSQLPWGTDSRMPRLVCYWTPKDLLLLPPRSAVVQGAEEVCVAESTHLGFILKPVIWESIFRVLTPDLQLAQPYLD